MLEQHKAVGGKCLLTSERKEFSSFKIFQPHRKVGYSYFQIWNKLKMVPPPNPLCKEISWRYIPPKKKKKKVNLGNKKSTCGTIKSILMMANQKSQIHKLNGHENYDWGLLWSFRVVWISQRSGVMARSIAAWLVDPLRHLTALRKSW